MSKTGQHSLTGPGRGSRLIWWALGLTGTALRFVTQRVPLYRRDRQHVDSPVPDLDREVPGDTASLQRAGAGHGSLFHRKYWIYVTDEKLGPEELMEHMVADLNRVTPTGMASFQRRDGQQPQSIDVGDELVVRLPGPWNGPVRVVERSPTTFRFMTLKGHMEAGEIEFRTSYDERGFLLFEINSWTRSGDQLFRWLYERFPLGREMQLFMWSQVCQRVAKLSGGVPMSSVASCTRMLA